MSCGSTSCDDGNACTADSCSSGSCTHTNVDSVLGCVDDLTVSVCSGGSLTEHNCGRLAREHSSNNGTYGCRDDICMSANYADRPTCTADERACTQDSSGAPYLAMCLRDDTGQTYWYFQSCTKICLDGGWDSATGECGPGTDGPDVCFCR